MTEQKAPAQEAAPGTDAQGEDAVSEEAPKKSRAGRVIIGIIGVVVALAMAGVVKFGLAEAMAFITGDTSKAEVGDCITESASADDMKTVDCADAAAAYKVVGVLEEQTQAQAESGCIAFDEAEQYIIEYEGTLTDSTKGRILCLATNS